MILAEMVSIQDESKEKRIELINAQEYIWSIELPIVVSLSISRDNAIDRNMIVSIISKLEWLRFNLIDYMHSVDGLQDYVKNIRIFKSGMPYISNGGRKHKYNTIQVVSLPAELLKKVEGAISKWRDILKSSKNMRQGILDNIDNTNRTVFSDVVLRFNEYNKVLIHNIAIVRQAMNDNAEAIGMLDGIANAVISILTALIAISPFVFAKKENSLQ